MQEALENEEKEGKINFVHKTPNTQKVKMAS